MPAIPTTTLVSPLPPPLPPMVGSTTTSVPALAERDWTTLLGPYEPRTIQIATPGPLWQSVNSPSASPNSFWTLLSGVLRPVLPPRIAEVLLSPLLILEVVLRAFSESGYALLLPGLAMAGLAGIAYWRLTPPSIYAPTQSSRLLSFLKP